MKIGVNSEEWIEKKALGLVADTYFDGDELALELQKAVSKLPEKQRIIFNMKYFCIITRLNNIVIKNYIRNIFFA